MFFLTKFKTCFKQKKLFKIKKTVCFVLNKKNMFFANPAQGVLLHRFPPLKPCANEFSLPFSYLYVLRHWRDSETQQERKKAFAQGLNGGKRSRKTP
jgi:hypothetical protein